MAIAHVETKSHNQSTGATSWSTPTLDAAPSSGDYIRLVVYLQDGDTGSRAITWPSGFTETVLKNNMSSATYAEAEKIAGASEPTSYTVSWTITSYTQEIITAVYSGVDNTTPNDATLVESNGTGWSNSHDNETITTVTDKAWALHSYGVKSDSGSTEGGDANWTTRAQGARIGLFDQEVTLAGACDVGTFEHDWGNHYRVTTALRPAAAGNDQISGAAAGTSTGSGALTGKGALAGSSAGSSTVSGIVTAVGALAGSSAGLSTASGTVTAVGALAGSSAGSSTASGTVTAVGALAGSSSGLSTASGTVTAVGSLAGAAAGSSTATGDLTSVSDGALAGSAAGTATASGTLTAVGALAGSSAGTSTATAVLYGVASIAGQSAGNSTATAVLSGWGYLYGAAAGNAAGTAVLTGTGALAGAAAGTSTATLAYDATVVVGEATLADTAYYTAVVVDSDYYTAVVADSAYYTAVLEDATT